MNLKEILDLKYPTETAAGLIRCNSKDMTEWTIGTWDVDFSKPDQKDLDQWNIEFEPEYIKQQNRKDNAPLYAALEDIDSKSIRALRSNDTERLKQLEVEAQTIRGQLK